MGRGYSEEHAAALAAQLPRESRIVRILQPNAAWGWQEHLLANIEYWLHVLVWFKTKDGEKGRNRPRPIDISDTDASRERRREHSHAVRRHVEDVLGKREA